MQREPQAEVIPGSKWFLGSLGNTLLFVRERIDGSIEFDAEGSGAELVTLRPRKQPRKAPAPRGKAEHGGTGGESS